MKKLFPLLFLCLLAQLLNAQDKSVFNRLHGADVKEYLTITIEPTSRVMKYVLDGKDAKTSQPIENTRFYVDNTNENSVNVYLNFYNPLQLSVQTKNSEIEDPNSVVINAFFKQFSAFSQISYETKHQVIPEKSLPNPTEESTLGNYLLFQWNLEFKQNLQQTKANKNDVTKINDKLSQLSLTETYLFGKISFEGESFSVEDGIKHFRKKLYEAANYEDFKTCLTQLNGFIEATKLAKKVAQKNLETVITQLSTDYDGIDKLIATKQKSLFKLYTASTVNATKGLTEPRFKYYDELISNTETLAENCKLFLSKFTTENSRSEVRLKFPWDKEVINQYTYTIISLDENGTAIPNKTNVVNFSIGKKVKIAFFSSTGYLVTNYAENKYGVKTNAGINSVERISENRFYGKPVFFLNGIISNNWNSGTYFFGQIGLSYDEGAIVPVGVGILIYNKVSLSGGAIIGRVKELPGNINIGDPISDNVTLQNSLVDQLKGGFYISLSYNIGTLGK